MTENYFAFLFIDLMDYCGYTKNFALKVAQRRKSGEATLNIYSIEENEAFKECSLLRFETPDEKFF